MSFCPAPKKVETIKACSSEPKPVWQWLVQNREKVGVAAIITSACALFTKRHAKPLVLSIAGLTVIGQTVLFYEHKLMDMKIRHIKPCTSIFDTFRFTIPPTCNIQPREQPLVFYDKEPIKPVPDDGWYKNLPYTNKPPPCKKKLEKKVMENAHKPKEYGNNDGECNY